MSRAPAPVKEGDVLAGKYRVERVLGVGGMGVVVSATHVQLGQRVALKFLLPDAAENPDAVARFLREGQAAVRLRGEHVAQVSDVGTLDSGSPYMVMEHLDGTDLSVHLSRRGALPPEEACDYLLQVCEALAEAHAAGIIHRDLKPANFFLATRPDGTPIVKVLDFGISKLADGSGAALTQTSSVMGSPLYMSPEQLRSTKHVDARTDVWALGASLFELLTGKVPFPGDTMPELCTSVLMTPTPSLRALDATLPAGLDALLQSALQKDLERRCPDVAQFARGLLPFAPRGAHVHVERVERLLGRAGHAVRAPVGHEGEEVNPEGATVHASTQSTFGTSRGHVPSKRGAGPLVAGAVVAVAAAAVGLLATRTSSTPSAAPVVTAPAVPSSEPRAEPAASAAPSAPTPAVSAPATSASASQPPAAGAPRAAPKAPQKPTPAATPVDPYADTRK